MNSKRSWQSFELHPAGVHGYTNSWTEFAEPEAVEPALSSEPRETWLFSPPHATKEVLIRSVQPLECPALYRDGQAGCFAVAVTPLGERLRLVNVVARDTGFAIGID